MESNAPAIKGSIVTFTADLLELNGTLANVGENSPLKWVRFNIRILFKYFIYSVRQNNRVTNISNIQCETMKNEYARTLTHAETVF